MPIKSYPTYSENPFGASGADYVMVSRGAAAMITDLGTRGYTLLCYIIENMQLPVIRLNRRMIITSSRYGNLRGTGYYHGIEDLLSHGIIARVEGHPEMYHINPNVLKYEKVVIS